MENGKRVIFFVLPALHSTGIALFLVSVVEAGEKVEKGKKPPPGREKSGERDCAELGAEIVKKRKKKRDSTRGWKTGLWKVKKLLNFFCMKMRAFAHGIPCANDRTFTCAFAHVNVRTYRSRIFLMISSAVARARLSRWIFFSISCRE